MFLFLGDYLNFNVIFHTFVQINGHKNFIMNLHKIHNKKKCRMYSVESLASLISIETCSFICMKMHNLHQ